ncbi:MAG: 50S ribosomal protein L25 [Candidatus Sumerlaeaceae bacterium]
MKRFDLAVVDRQDIGKGANRRLRSSGKIPAVIYGAESDARKVTLDYREFDKLIASPGGETGLLDLKSNGGASNVAIIREVQRDPVTRRFLHVDLYAIRMDQENNFEVAVHGVGIPVGVREGGLLETHIRSVTVRCLPANIPNVFNIDLLGLKGNQSVHVSDIKVPENVTMVTDPHEVLFTVIVLRAEKVVTEEAAAAEAAPAAPEVIGKKKAEEGDAKPPAKK